MMKFKKVLIFGGTHGNEWAGIRIVENYVDHFKQKFPKLELEFILANPEAYRLNRRFKDEDLNRAFQYLGEARKDSYEHDRARELRDLILRGECYVIDLHTTTSNMGKTLVVSDYHPFNLELCARVREKFSTCKVIGAPDPEKRYLSSQTPFGVIVEIGPTANSIVDPIVLEETYEILHALLEGISEQKTIINRDLEIFEEVENVQYPVNEKGEISSYIHSSFQGKDFTAVKGKYLAFTSFKNAPIQRETSEELYPIFINEAAYYPQQLAFILARRKILAY